MSSLQAVDVVLGVQHGDEGKGKVVHHLCRNGDYTLVFRGQGGPNAGHTIYHEGEKYVTHLVPAGVFFGIPSLIGPGCVVDLSKLYHECTELDEKGIDVKNLLHIDARAHLILSAHLEEDSKDSETTGIGTTKCGIGPAYTSKYHRSGLRFGDLIEQYYSEEADSESHGSSLIPYFENMLVDTYDLLHNNDEPVVALFEGGQGFELDIDWGDYPYVTSSHTTTAGALLNGIPPQTLRRVYGVAKAYETYVGAKKFQRDDKACKLFQELGQEYGATTGRLRQTDYLHLPRLKRAITINGVTDLIINKCDIMRAASEAVKEDADDSRTAYRFYNTDESITMLFEESMWQGAIAGYVRALGVENVIFSAGPEAV